MTRDLILSFDIGGTKIAYGLVKNNRILSYQKILWQKPLNSRKIINKIVEVIENCKLPSSRDFGELSRAAQAKRKIENFKAIALGIAGQVDFKEGSVVLSPNISKKREKIFLKKILEKKFNLPVFLDNDVNCFTLGEAIFGLGKGERIVLGLTIGTGIGGGVVIEKKIFRGKDGFASEFGHMTLEVGGHKCVCGKRGCFEAYASGRAMREIYFGLTGQRKNTFFIEEEFYRKKPEAIFTVNETARWLAIGLANLINIFNPDLIILGGGMACFQPFIKIALKNIKPWLLVKEIKSKILISRLREKAGILGAALLTKEL